MLDYTIALPLLIVSAPFLAAFALWIKIVSRVLLLPASAGRQKRKTNHSIKLRTMHSDSGKILEQYLARIPTKNQTGRGFISSGAIHAFFRISDRFCGATAWMNCPQLWNVLVET